MKIYVMTHKPFTKPEEEIYTPLHVGSANALNLGYPGDHTGENISEKNKYYGELTGLYWVWKNVTDEDILGLCHYRRYFLNENGNIMTEQDYRQILCDYDIIISKSTIQKETYREIYARCHNIADLETTGEAIREYYPDYYPAFREALAGTQNYVGNLFVTSAPLLMQYSEWLFSVLEIVEKRIDVESYDAYHKRVFGFLSEQLLYVWVKTNGLKAFEATYGVTQDKAETLELKQRVAELLRDRKPQEALSFFQKTIGERPDVLLPVSDSEQELYKIYPVLLVCSQEAARGQTGMLNVSTDIAVLLQHYELVKRILGHIINQTVSTEEIDYLKNARVSYALCKEIIIMEPEYQQYETALMEILGEILT